MRVVVAVILFVVALASAEPPRFGTIPQSARQSAPYNPRGWRPNGPSFDLPQRQQVYVPPVSAPQATYGAPQQQQQQQQEQQNYLPPRVEYGPPEPNTRTVETTTAAEEAIATQQPAKLVEDIEVNSKSKPEKLEEPKQQKPVFLIVPQPERLVYTLQESAPLLAVPQSKVLANLQAVPLAQAALATSYYTPTFSSSYVQIYQ